MSRGLAAIALALLLTLVAGLQLENSAVVPRPRPAAPHPPLSTRADWVSLSRRLAAPWPDTQLPSGGIPDPLRNGHPGTYGDGTIGLALLQAGVRDRNWRLVRGGLRAVSSETRLSEFRYNTHPFRVWVVAAAYGIAHRRLAHRRPARAAMRRWTRWLEQQPSTWLWGPPYENKVLLGALGVIEAQRTGLQSPVQGSVLGSAARARAVDLVNRTVPALSASSAHVLSDPPQNPIAYHALSHAMYARAVRLLGPQASWRARRALRRVARASWLAMAPDGSVAYWGRSQGQSWAQSAAAYGLAATARESGSAAGADRRYYALATRALQRLGAYGVGPRGGHIVPALSQDRRGAVEGLDPYARAPEYAGLTMVFLNWAIPLLPHHGGGRIAADRSLSAVLSKGSGRFVTIRRGTVWFAAREGAGNLQYDFGPVAAQRLERGRWRHVIPSRPKGDSGYDSAGPVLLTAHGRGLPVGYASRVTRDGRVVVRGGFRRGGWVRRGVRFVFRPTHCGVEVAVLGRAGDRYEFSAFFREPPSPTVGERRVRSRRETVVFNLPISSSSLERGYHSASDARLTRGRFVVEPRRAQRVSMELC